MATWMGAMATESEPGTTIAAAAVAAAAEAVWMIAAQRLSWSGMYRLNSSLSFMCPFPSLCTCERFPALSIHHHQLMQCT